MLFLKINKNYKNKKKTSVQFMRNYFYQFTVNTIQSFDSHVAFEIKLLLTAGFLQAIESTGYVLLNVLRWLDVIAAVIIPQLDTVKSILNSDEVL